MDAWKGQIETTHFGRIDVWVHEYPEGYGATPVTPLPVTVEKAGPIAPSRQDALAQLARAIERAGPPTS
jgi:hypothetical protein